MATGSRVQVLVVGAGIGGLSLAGFLERAGMEPVVVDRAETLDTARGTVELPPGAVRLLGHLGVEAVVHDAGGVLTTWTRRHPDGTVVTRLDADDEFGLLAVEYTRLRRALRDRLSDDTVHTGTALRALDPGRGGVTVTFANGVREQFDVVVGADGVRSRTRAALGGSEPVFCGTTSLPLTLDTDPGVEFDGASEVWAPDGAVFRVLPVEDRLTGWLTVPATVPGQDWKATSPAELCPEIDWLLPAASRARAGDHCMDDFRVPADRLADGRVALLGDAAHARHRLAGVGPALALEDAAVLASELVGRDDPPAARLVDYAAQRGARLSRLGRPGDDGGSDSPLAGVESALADRHPTIPRTRGARLAAGFGPDPPTLPVGTALEDGALWSDGDG
ncbi:FAD-dependent oxidoreductase [Haloglomus litoreum]|uniref:FAD-dependent oxidoreductase n=1 Tax=Haloglomus litoreum TaxID=3034026 RepID=UPI0023E891B3|nr:NAD(P)/FAD-dependent oxidoreductase [Haloglomus sp. DT116]